MTGGVISERVVLEKLNKLRLVADFKNTRWVHEWDLGTAPVEGIDKAHREKTILQKFANEGVISLKIEDISDAIPGKSFNRKKDYQISDTVYLDPSSDRGKPWLDWAIWITDFNFQRFLTACKNVDFDPVAKTEYAIFNLQDGYIPVVTIKSIKYYFKPLQENAMPAKLLAACVSSKTNKLEEGTLFKLTGSNKTNVKKILADTDFSDGGILNDFVNAAPHKLSLNLRAVLDAQTVALLKSKALNQEKFHKE